MRLNQQVPVAPTPANDTDPREQPGAEVIDLATRNVLPQVARRSQRSELLAMAAGAGFVGLLGVATLWSLDNTRGAANASKPAAPTQVAAPAPAPVDAAPPVPAAAITPAPGAAPAPPPQAVLAAPPQGLPQAESVPNRAATPTIVFDASALPVPAVLPGAGAASGAPNAQGDDFAARVGGVGGSAATATASIDPRTTVTQGTLIPAVLETAIDTDVPGYVRAIVSSDVRSFDGTRVLIPRSSRLIGQYKSGVQAGQKRAYVIWTRLIRTDGVTVNIASPATGFGGETGLAGKVDSHFFERFGSALLLSVVGGLSALGGNAGVIVAGGGQSAAAAAVGQSGQIGPTIRVRQGEPIRVFTARDLDFSKVTAQ